MLNEQIATSQWEDGDQNGDFGTDHPGYTWTIQDDAWPEDTMRLVTVTVTYSVQGTEYEEKLSTLVAEESTTGTTSATSTTGQ